MKTRTWRAFLIIFIRLFPAVEIFDRPASEAFPASAVTVRAPVRQPLPVGIVLESFFTAGCRTVPVAEPARLPLFRLVLERRT